VLKEPQKLHLQKEGKKKEKNIGERELPNRGVTEEDNYR
jgi:hypothetical protein